MRAHYRVLELPYPPSANRYWRVWRGRAVMSAEARAYKARVGQLYAHLAPMEGALGVRIRVTRPARRGDLDNTLKVALDALKGLAYHDDRQLVQLTARLRRSDKHRAGLRVVLFSTRDPEARR